MKKIVRLTESDLIELVNRVIKEQMSQPNTKSGNNDPSLLFNKMVSELQNFYNLSLSEVRVLDNKLSSPEICKMYNGVCCKKIIVGNNNKSSAVWEKSDWVEVKLNCKDMKIKVYQGQLYNKKVFEFPLIGGVQPAIDKIKELRKNQVARFL